VVGVDQHVGHRGSPWRVEDRRSGTCRSTSGSIRLAVASANRDDRMESIGEIPDRGVRVIADGTAEDVRASWAMPSDDLIPRLRLLIAT